MERLETILTLTVIALVTIIAVLINRCIQYIEEPTNQTFSNQTNQTIIQVPNCSMENELKDFVKESAIANFSTNYLGIKGFSISGWIDDFGIGGSVTYCRNGNNEGENINYWYCTVDINMAKDIVDSNGIITENIRKKVNKLTLDSDFNVTEIDCRNCVSYESCDPRPLLKSKEELCTLSGGTVTNQLCCKSASDFPDMCLIGACGCSEENSHEVKICNCGEESCWDSIKVKCVSTLVI